MTFLGIPTVREKKASKYGDGKAWQQGDPLPENTLRWGGTFQQGAHTTLHNEQMHGNLRHATGVIRNKRALRVSEMPDWEELRDAATAIKDETAARLPELLVQMEENVTKRGGVVHWARDAKEANEIILGILQEKQVDEVVKVKSMVTQEINMNEYLKDHGITAVETDLAETIVQLGDDMPSHIVVPALHRNRDEIQKLFKAKIKNASPDLSNDPRELANTARAYLREKFLKSKVAISGSNMMIAETGTLSVYESEGNGRMCLTLPETLISVVGIEKIVPRFRDAEVFSQLLPRSATGERMNPYTTFWTGVTPGDGPQEFHLVLLDNGRSEVLADPVGQEALRCIRCGACMNVCPVYEHVGGHAYGSVYPGPIGAILTPQLLNAMKDRNDPASSLPYASSLCGACNDVCPVRINFTDILVHLRHETTENARGGAPDVWDGAMKALTPIMSSGKAMEAGGKALHLGRAIAKDDKITNVPVPIIKGWTDARDVPAPPKESFREWYKKEYKK